MNRTLLIDAVSHLDETLIENYIVLRRRMKQERALKRRLRILCGITVAACILAVCVCTVPVAGVIGQIRAETMGASALGARDIAVALTVCACFSAMLGGVIWRVGRGLVERKWGGSDGKSGKIP